MTLRDRAQVVTVAEWINGLDDERDILNGAKIDVARVKRYSAAIDDADVGYISMRAADYAFCDSWLDREIGRGLDAVLAECKSINNQFDDDYYLVDCLLSCELLDGFYSVDGAIYQRHVDSLVA